MLSAEKVIVYRACLGDIGAITKVITFLKIILVRQYLKKLIRQFSYTFNLIARNRQDNKQHKNNKIF